MLEGMSQEKAPVPDSRLLLNVEEAAQLLSLGRNTLYSLMLSGQIASLKIGRLRRVPVSALKEFVRHQTAA